MKIAIEQINFHIGNFEENESRIIGAIHKARDEGADLIVFSEFSVAGYPPMDMLEREEFIVRCEKSLSHIASNCEKIAAIVGGPLRNTSSGGKNLYNAAYFMYGGEIKNVVCKSLLPTYDIFDEYRYFEPNKEFSLIEYKGKRIALTVCEDLWDEQEFESDFSKGQLYTVSPMEELSKQDPDLVVNIAASPYSYHRETEKREIFLKKAKKYQLPVIVVNQVGGQTELIFEGGSMVICPNGTLFQRLPFFEEAGTSFDLGDLADHKAAEEEPEAGLIIQHIHDALVMGIRDYFSKMGFSKAVLGLSGGIDSAVCLVLATEALGKDNVLALRLPSKYSSDHSITDSEALARNLGIAYETLHIQDSMNSFEQVLKPYFKDLEEDITEENIQARIRAILLMAFSNKFGSILLNTSNKSEAAVGYGTLYGDMAGGLSVLGDVYKSDVYNLARYINSEFEIIPCHIIEKAPSAELKPDQKDSDALPDYDVLDQILYRFIELQRSPEKIIQEGFNPDLVHKIVRLVTSNEYKRYQSPPILRISSKSFGLGRRFPLAASYDFLTD